MFRNESLPEYEDRPPYLLKDDLSGRTSVIDLEDLEEIDRFEGIRCPLCRWQPSPSDRWSCLWTAPEPHFASCGSVWNTFLTRGCCPGCRHQWQWTSCLRCGAWSKHEDWYDVDDSQPPS